MNVGSAPFIYRKNYTVGRLEQGVYQTLSFADSGLNWENNRLTLPLESGYYRLLTSNRQIDGSVLLRTYYAELRENAEILLEISMRESQLRSRLQSLPIHDMKLKSLCGNLESLKTVLSSHSPCILAVIDIGKEPTEHLLNEIIWRKDQLAERGISVICLACAASDLRDGTFLRAISLPFVKVLLWHGENFPPARLFDDLKLGDHRLPLAAAIGKDGSALFAFSNYNVGTVDLLLQIDKCSG